MNISFSKISPHLNERQSRLALSYLAVIMFLTLVFSIVIYKTSSVHFDRFRPTMMGQIIETDNFQERRIKFISNRKEAKNALITDLVVLNTLALFGGSLFSYYLAGRTLKPIEDAIENQNRFISDASHELRTPLSTLQVSNEVMLKSSDKLPSDIKELLENNVEQAERLSKLTDGLLGAIKAEHIEYKKNSFDLLNAINEAKIILDAEAIMKNIKIETPKITYSVIGDESSIIRVLVIFLENAVKYSPLNGKIQMLVKERSNEVDLSIKDFGIGIASKDRDNIFRRFYRSDSSRSSQNTKGYGLGLAIAKTICDKQGIPIKVKSKIGSGSTFTITLQKSIH